MRHVFSKNLFRFWPQNFWTFFKYPKDAARFPTKGFFVFGRQIFQTFFKYPKGAAHFLKNLFRLRAPKILNIFYMPRISGPKNQPIIGPFWGAFGALKVLPTVNPATLCSSNRMEIIPQSDFNILTKIMPRNAKDMDVHYCAFWGKVHLFAQKCTFGAGEKRRKTHPWSAELGIPGTKLRPHPQIFEHFLNTQKVRHIF